VIRHRHADAHAAPIVVNAIADRVGDDHPFAVSTDHRALIVVSGGSEWTKMPTTSRVPQRRSQLQLTPMLLTQSRRQQLCLSVSISDL